VSESFFFATFPERFASRPRQTTKPLQKDLKNAANGIVVAIQTTLYEELLKKEGEITALKVKALQLMRTHEEAVGYDDMRQQLEQLGNNHHCDMTFIVLLLT